MAIYCIVERDDGLTIVEQRAGQSPEDAAQMASGTLVDPGPYPTQEEAYEALVGLQQEVEDEASDTPDVGPLEERIYRPPT
jgi:hypothetical protein